jgi:tRNA threonylcarbamoyladenosine biosynthesis protein TsaE
VSDGTTVVLRSSSVDETRRIGGLIGALLRAGDVLLLQGELGSGKTTFTQGIGEAFDTAEPLKSPTFVLMNEYHGRLTLYHADLYRLDNPGEVFDLALEDVASDGVLIVEWPDRAPREMPPEHLLIQLEESGTDERTLTISPHGERYEAMLAALQQSAHR